MQELRKMYDFLKKVDYFWSTYQKRIYICSDKTNQERMTMYRAYWWWRRS